MTRPELTPEEFRLWSEWLAEEYGLQFGPERRDTLRNRLEPRRSALGLASFEDLRMTDVESVGGKNASLGEMISQLAGAGVRVEELQFDSMIHGFVDMAFSPAADEAIGLAKQRPLQWRLIPDPGRDEVVEPVVRDPLGPGRHRLDALAITEADQPGHIERAHRPARWMQQAPKERLQPPIQIVTPPAST